MRIARWCGNISRAISCRDLVRSLRWSLDDISLRGSFVYRIDPLQKDWLSHNHKWRG